ncbi:response regulator [Nostoc sp. MG11]|uniref:response regulator transcription factor n=1 Tax=Nostoc sp. MG11 TaxID=2721166 RepID=UPI0018662A3C|nr:response regulator [Nostoc sp. MG11]
MSLASLSSSNNSLNQHNQVSQTILIIEDDPIIRNLLLETIEASGFNVISAPNGLLGIEKAKKYLPDLIICDILMPDLDGYTVLTKLRQDPLSAIIPFIFLTCSNHQLAIRKGMELGANDYLTKPCELQDLFAAINVRLEKQAILKQWYTNNPSQVSQTSASLINSESIYPSIIQLKEVFDFIEANYHQGISLSDVALAVGYSSAYLSSLIVKETKMTVNTWILKRRMVAAQLLLKDSNQSIKSIATALGYQTASHFSRHFRQYYNICPLQWRTNYQKHN